MPREASSARRAREARRHALRHRDEITHQSRYVTVEYQIVTLFFLQDYTSNPAVRRLADLVVPRRR